VKNLRKTVDVEPKPIAEEQRITGRERKPVLSRAFTDCGSEIVKSFWKRMRSCTAVDWSRP